MISKIKSPSFFISILPILILIVLLVLNVNIYGEVLKNAGNKTLLVVQKGDALWKIAYQRLGGGQNYVDIIKLNKDKINNPDLIFPKQLFILP